MGSRLAWFQAAFLLGLCCFPSSPKASPKAEKIHWINGHSFEKQHLNTHALCAYCKGRFRKPKNKCYSCKACCTVVHKGCRWAAAPCTENPQLSSTPILEEATEIWDKCPPAEDAHSYMPEKDVHCTANTHVAMIHNIENTKENFGECPPEEDNHCSAKPQVSILSILREAKEKYDKCQGKVDVKAKENFGECPPEEDNHCSAKPHVSILSILREAKEKYDKCQGKVDVKAKENLGECPPEEDNHCSAKPHVSILSILREAKEEFDKCQGKVDVKAEENFYKCSPVEEDHCSAKPHVSILSIPQEAEENFYKGSPVEEDHCSAKPHVSILSIPQEAEENFYKCSPVEEDHCSAKPHVSILSILREAKEKFDKCQGKVDVKEPCKIMKPVTLEDFDTIQILGEGSFSKVLLVRSKQDNKDYAMKVIKKKRVCARMQMVWAEKMVLQQASPCPFLIGLHSCFQTPSWLCFITNYAHGGDLSNLVLNHGARPEDHIRFYTAEIALGIEYLHQNGIIHRDIKLNNILLDHEGHALITDFGMCKMLTGRHQKTRTMCGTPYYCAPEIIEEQEYGFAVDWWALGICLCVMASDSYPHPDYLSIYSFQDMRAIVCEPQKVPEDISDELYQLLHGFLEYDPEERLGGDPQYGMSDIQQHPFFHGLDWDKVQKKQIMPPYQPPSVPDLKRAFQQLTPECKTSGQEIDQSLFVGFDYVAPF